MNVKNKQHMPPIVSSANLAIGDQVGVSYRAPRFESIKFTPGEIFATGSHEPAPNYLDVPASTYFSEKYNETFLSAANEFFSSVSVGLTGQLGLIFIGPGPYAGSAVSFGLNTRRDMVIQFQTVYGIGLGTYAGAGAGFQMGTASAPVEGWQKGVQAELNFGWGAAWGAQIQISDGGWGIGSGLSGLVASLSSRALGLRDGRGFGAHVSVGITNTRTIIIRRSDWSTTMSERGVHTEQLRLHEWSQSARKR